MINAPRFQRLSREEEVELYLKWIETADTAIRTRFIESIMPFVLKMSGRYSMRGRFYSGDLASEGVLGAIEAFKRFDPHRGIRFLTYAAWWVREWMRRFVSSNRVLISKAELRTELKYRDSELNLARKAIRCLAINGDGSYEPPVERSDRTQRIFFPELVGQRDDEDVIATRQLRMRVRKLLDRCGHVLTKGELAIIRMRWLEWVDGEQPTLASCCAKLSEVTRSGSCSRERARQLEASALRKMRSQAGAELRELWRAA